MPPLRMTDAKTTDRTSGQVTHSPEVLMGAFRFMARKHRSTARSAALLPRGRCPVSHWMTGARSPRGKTVGLLRAAEYGYKIVMGSATLDAEAKRFTVEVATAESDELAFTMTFAVADTGENEPM